MDDDGGIDVYEFTCALAFIVKKPVADRLSSIFRIADIDDSQSLSIDKMADIIFIIMMIAHKHDDGDDVDRCAKAMIKIDDIVKHRIDDRSMYVTLDDFCDIVQADCQLIKALTVIGIFASHELGLQVHDKDLQLELEKFEGIEANLNSQKDKGQGNQTNGTQSDSDAKGLLGILASELELHGLDFENDLYNTSKPDSFTPTAGDTSEPNIDFRLDYVYGYRCHDVRNNVFFNDADHLIFHASQIGIQLDYVNRRQKFIMQETHEISCMDTFGDLTATGEISVSPMLSLWNNTSMQMQASFGVDISHGISHVKFSNDGRTIAIATMDHFRSIVLLSTDRLIDGHRRGSLKFTCRSCHRQVRWTERIDTRDVVSGQRQESGGMHESRRLLRSQRRQRCHAQTMHWMDERRYYDRQSAGALCDRDQ